MPINTSVPLESSLQGLLLLLSQQLVQNGRPDLAGHCEQVAGQIGAVKIPFRLATTDLLCAACDEMHRRNDDEAVAALEGLVAALKGGKKRRIVGGLNYNATTVGEIHDAAEKLVKHAERQAGG